MPPRKAPRYGRRIVYLVVHLALAAFFSVAYYTRYHIYRDCFNERGRCYDPETAQVITTGALAWGFLAAIFATLALLSVVRLAAKYLRRR